MSIYCVAQWTNLLNEPCGYVVTRDTDTGPTVIRIYQTRIEADREAERLRERDRRRQE